MTLDPPPTPSQLFRLFEVGRISRDELHAAMAVHARQIIDEMVEARRNPIAAYFEELLNRKAAARLARLWGERAVREALSALAEAPDFPPANLLWNAGHTDVPLHCFIRTRREPIFRVLRLQPRPGGVEIAVEHGKAKRRESMREQFFLRRDRWGRLAVDSRRSLD